jgi:hypothetical protein
VRPQAQRARCRVSASGSLRLVVAVAVVVTVFAPGATAAAATGPYHLAAVRPFLFFNDSGRLSKEVPESASLWNTIIGEGWAGESSNATLVRVEITGPSGSYSPGRSVRLSVRKGRATATGVIFRAGATVRTSSIPVLTRSGRTTLGFWIADTGCTPLQLTAELRGQSPTERLTRVLNFACGE